MEDREIERHLGALEDVAKDDSGKAWEAVRALTAAAVAGEDVGRALDALERICVEPARGALRGGAAKAVIAHALRTKDVPRLRALVSKLGRNGVYPESLYDGLEELAKAGLDLTPAVPLLMAIHAEDEGHRNVIPGRVADLLVRHAKRTGDLPGLVRGLLENPRLENLGFIHVAHRLGCPVEPALPALVEQLAGSRLGREASLALALLAANGVDVAGVVRDLERHLGHEDDTVHSGVVRALARHRAVGRDWARVDALLARDARARRGTGQVLRELLEEGRDDPEVVSRVAAGLADDDRDTRARTAEALRGAQDRKLRIEPPEGVVERLVAALDDEAKRGPIAEYLQATATPERAPVLLRALSEGTSRAALDLRAACEEVVRGSAVRACSICIRLPRDSRNTSWPEAYHSLRERGSALWCPECGRAYLAAIEDVDDGTSQLGIPVHWHNLTRLTPPRTRERLEGDALAEYSRGHDARIARLRAELRHPRLEVRVEAAIDLAACFVDARAWAELAELARTSEGPALVRALELALAEPAAPPQVLDSLRSALLASADGETRCRAASVLAVYFIGRRDLEAMRALLSEEDAEVLRGVVQPLYAWSDTFDPSPFSHRLEQLRRHSSQVVRDLAKWTLKAIDQRKGPAKEKSAPKKVPARKKAATAKKRSSPAKKRKAR